MRELRTPGSVRGVPGNQHSYRDPTWYLHADMGRKKTRPRIFRQQHLESAYIFGAVCAQRDAAVGPVLPYANTKNTALNLQEISKAVPPGRHAVLILDQAGWHTTPKLPQFPNITLLSLPAGSPELNPAEQVWQHLRDRSLANRCYDIHEQIVEAFCDA